jgi:hypothetical protein
MKVESRDGKSTTYVDIVAGRERRATTANGPQAAERMFAIMRAQGGTATSTPMRQTLTLKKPAP